MIDLTLACSILISVGLIAGFTMYWLMGRR